MEFKLLDNQNAKLMIDFVDDENTIYTIENINAFINDKNNLGFIAKDNGKVVAFSYGYILIHPNGKKIFYFDSIDVIKEYQGKGIGTELMTYTKDYVKSIGCKEMFLMTNKSNTSACKCYEKSGGISEANDDVVYVYNFEGDK